MFLTIAVAGCQHSTLDNQSLPETPPSIGIQPSPPSNGIPGSGSAPTTMPAAASAPVQSGHSPASPVAGTASQPPVARSAATGMLHAGHVYAARRAAHSVPQPNRSGEMPTIAPSTPITSPAPTTMPALRLQPLRTILTQAQGPLPRRVVASLPPVCRYEPPDPVPSTEQGDVSLGDIAVSADGATWLPEGFLDARSAPPPGPALNMIKDLDQSLRITDMRMSETPSGAEWRIRAVSQEHASGGDHWILVLWPPGSRWIYRLDWDNTHLWSFPGQRNPLFETVADGIHLDKNGK